MRTVEHCVDVFCVSHNKTLVEHTGHSEMASALSQATQCQATCELRAGSERRIFIIIHITDVVYWKWVIVCAFLMRLSIVAHTCLYLRTHFKHSEHRSTEHVSEAEPEMVRWISMHWYSVRRQKHTNTDFIRSHERWRPAEYAYSDPTRLDLNLKFATPKLVRNQTSHGIHFFHRHTRMWITFFALHPSPI